jgi:phospholipase/carboxylesterase
MLAYDLQLPEQPEDGAPLVVLLHGRGSDRHDLAGLHGYLPAGTMLVTPEAPFPAAPWGYGPGSAWYRLESEGVPDEATFTESLEALREFLSELPVLLPAAPGALTLGGFSQGGTTSLGYALVHPGSVGGVINLSGFVPRHPLVQVAPTTVARTRFFWGHGTADTAIPFALAVRGRAELAQAGADLTTHEYAMGHGVSPTELGDLGHWLREAAQSSGARVPRSDG